jgi:hypothetical protein
MWSADGGATWHSVEFYNKTACANASSAILAAINKKGLPHTFTAEDAANGAFQAPNDMTKVEGLAANLEAYSGQTVDVIFAAVPKADPMTLCVITVVTGVKVP